MSKRAAAQRPLGRHTGRRAVPPEPPAPPPPVLGYLALAFFALVVPWIMLNSAASEVSAPSLEARCRAAHAASQYLQYAVSEYIFWSVQRFQEDGISETRMVVRDMSDPALALEEQPATEFTCRLGALRRVQLRPLRD